METLWGSLCRHCLAFRGDVRGVFVSALSGILWRRYGGLCVGTLWRRYGGLCVGIVRHFVEML